MPRRSEYLDWLLEQLAPLGSLRTRSMFGSFGIYCDDLFFAIISDDVLFVKVDDLTRKQFEEEGLHAFTYPMKDGTSATLSYYPLPDCALETPHELIDWAKKGLAAALRAQKPVKTKKSQG